ncbi:hypothetical protein BKA62DRAFT_792949 [Auriculariales sp. MPI-PUGE-AT-0066]|nr:hypothetical protein BKA62DRAFT_792949 [Auriculariales sp. MPI-PUGE-AT-0066]
MEHDDYNAILGIIRPVMKTLPVLNNVLEGSVEVMRAISAQVEAARKNKEDLDGLFKHAAAVQVQIVLALRDRPGENENAVLESVNQFLMQAWKSFVLKAAKDLVARHAGVENPGIMRKMARGTAQFFKAPSISGKIADMRQRISDAAVVFGIAADIRTEERVDQVRLICERFAQEQREANERAEEDRAEIARLQREIVERADQAEREMNRKADEKRDAEEQKSLDTALRPAHAAAHYSGTAPRPCAEGTRVSILSEMQEWAMSVEGPLVYWLAGLAGTGKTTIASSFCRQLEAAGVNLISFFISRSSPERNTLSAVISTLAHQLGQCIRPIADQTQALLVAPLAAMSDDDAATAPHQLVIVIDAMDECDNFADSDGRLMIAALVAVLRHVGHAVKLLLTSRYEPDLRIMLDGVFKDSHSDREIFLLHEVDEVYVSSDIRTFVTNGLSDLRTRFPDLPPSWPSQYHINELVEVSGKLLFGAHERSPYAYLDALYLTILQKATSDPDPESEMNSRLRRLLFLVTNDDSGPVCPQILSCLLQVDDHELNPLLNSLSAVLQLPTVSDRPDATLGRHTKSRPIISDGPPRLRIPLEMQVRIFHKSFFDFVVDPKRCTDVRFIVSGNREEPPLALAMLHAIEYALDQLEQSQSITNSWPSTDREKHQMALYYVGWSTVFLRNSLTSTWLDCARVLALLRTPRIKQALVEFEIYTNASGHMQIIIALLSALVKQLPECVRGNLEEDIASYAKIIMSMNGDPSDMYDMFRVVAATAVIMHSQLQHESDHADEPGAYNAKANKRREKKFHRLVCQLEKCPTEDGRQRLVDSAIKAAQRCIPDLPHGNELILRLLEICMIARLRFG